LPNKPLYGATDILAPNVSWWSTRSDYSAATGNQAAAFVTGQPVKRWLVTGLSTTDPSAQYAFGYLGLDPSGNPAVLSMTLPASVAAALNMPGVVSFPTYATWLAGRAPTSGTVTYTYFGSSLVNPMDVSMLFTPDEASALAAEMSQQLSATFAAVPLTTPDGNATAVYNYDPSDSRRIYDLSVTVGAGTSQMYAMGGATGLFALRSSVGVGAPGTWSWTLNSDGKTTNYAAGPRWTAAVQSDGATEAREYPIPIRPLVSPPEQLVELLGNVVAVERTDLMTATAASGLTDAQSQALSDVQTKVTALWKTLPPSAQ
jgi:hypothetical protein